MASWALVLALSDLTSVAGEDVRHLADAAAERFGGDVSGDLGSGGDPPPASPPPPPPPPPPLTPQTHKIDVSVKDNMVQVHDHEVSGSDTSSKFYKVQTNGGGFMSMLNAEHSSAGANTSSVHFAIHVQEIMEVVLQDPAAGFQPEVDTVLKSERIGARNEWAPFVGGSESVGNATVSTFAVSDKQHFYAKGSIALSELAASHDASPDYIKYDFAVRKWPYSAKYTHSALTLKVLVIASQDDWKPTPFERRGHAEGKIDLAGDVSEADFHADGFLTWKTTAEECAWGGSVGSHCAASNASATPLDVVATRGHGKWMYFTFIANHSAGGAARGDIVWDPEMGATLSNSPAPHAPGGGIGAGGAVALTLTSVALLGIGLHPKSRRGVTTAARRGVERLTGSGTEATSMYARHDDRQ